MKEWFKYEFGYVNIDSDNLYLTNSGNWSETKDLTEKTRKVDTKNDNKSSTVIGFLILVLCIFAYLIYKSVVSGGIGITLIVLTLLCGYKLYDYLKSDIGAKFKIPREKITEISENGRSIEIRFINGEGSADSYTIQRVDDKGMSLMNAIIPHAL